MPQTATGSTALKEPPDAAPAQASTHARPRTLGRHRVDQTPTRPPAHSPHAAAPPQGGPDQRTPPTRGARHRLPAPMSLPRLPPCTHAALAHPTCRNGPSTHVLACTQWVPGNKVFCIWQPCARESGNKIESSAHGMGSGGLAVDAMAIGCLGVERRGERFFVLSHFSSEIRVHIMRMCTCVSCGVRIVNA